MNVLKLNEHLSGNKDAVETILANLGCSSIRYNAQRNEFRFAIEAEKNPTSSCINIDNLRFQCFSSGDKGSIYNLVMLKLGMNFPTALKWTARVLNLKESDFRQDIVLPFGGFYKKILHEKQEPEMVLPTYPESILEPYGHVANMSFWKDGITFQTQDNFLLGYDVETDRITIPQWGMNGQLIGIMGRSNDPNVPYEYRWLPILPCSRSHALYGYHQNYKGIQNKQICVITESEKGVMQLDSMGFPVGLATCTRNVSETQAKYLKALRVDKLILAYDEGVPEEALRQEALKLQVNNSLYVNKVGYIYDHDGEILKKGSKNSPTDLGREAFRELANHHTRWV